MSRISSNYHTTLICSWQPKAELRNMQIQLKKSIFIIIFLACCSSSQAIASFFCHKQFRSEPWYCCCCQLELNRLGVSLKASCWLRTLLGNVALAIERMHLTWPGSEPANCGPALPALGFSAWFLSLLPGWAANCNCNWQRCRQAAAALHVLRGFNGKMFICHYWQMSHVCHFNWRLKQNELQAARQLSSQAIHCSHSALPMSRCLTWPNCAAQRKRVNDLFCGQIFDSNVS